jgi:O-acetyl-ADP-ribose deacetylase (regulator of RNase III)
MDSLKRKNGNLLDADETIIAHGVNCSGVFNAGVAYQIRRRWPEVYESYIEKYKGSGWMLGDIQIVETNTKIIANLATQLGYGIEKVHVNYKAIETCFQKLLQYCYIHKLSVAIPKIGAGLAGGDWNIISTIIEKELKKYPVNLTVYIL